MNKILKNSIPAVFLFAAVFFPAVSVYSACTDNYHACRCRQWTGINLASLWSGATLNDCCTLKQSGCDVSANFTGSGTAAVQGSGASVTCKTPCSGCTGGQTSTGNAYQEDSGGCCKTAVTPKIYTADTEVMTTWTGNKWQYDMLTYICASGGTWEYPSSAPPNDRCGDRTTQSACYNDYTVSYQNEFNCSAYMNIPECSGSQTDQQICNSNGKGYKCKKSGTFTVINKTGNLSYCMCEWYGNYCGEASSGSCANRSLNGKGSIQYLSCE